MADKQLEATTAASASKSPSPIGNSAAEDRPWSFSILRRSPTIASVAPPGIRLTTTARATALSAARAR